MITADEFIGQYLEHRSEYDPAKAREYYLRTRELKGRKKGTTVDPRSNKTAEGDPLPKLGTRMAEDATPDVSPSGAKLVDYQAKGLGRAIYADGSVYDARTGWSKSQAPTKQARVDAAEKKIQRARIAARKLPVDKRNALEKRLNAAEKKLKEFKKRGEFKGRSILREAERTVRSAGDEVRRTRDVSGTVTSETRKDRFVKQKPSQNRNRA